MSNSSLDKTLALKKGSNKLAAFKVGEFIAEKAVKDGFDSKISFFADGIKKFEQAYQKGNLNGTNFRIGRHSFLPGSYYVSCP